MPISYRIDTERHLVLTEAWGVLTDQDLLGHKTRLMKDPLFRPGMTQLSDVRKIERLEVSSTGVQAMVHHDSADPGRKGHRLAIVVPSDEVFGMARMYQTMGANQASNVGVFRTLEEAVHWLKP